MTGAMVLDCKETRSGCYLNDGHGKFSFHAFGVLAQLAPVNAILVEDVDRDGFVDIVLGGNEYQASVMTGRYDASYGLWLKGNGKGVFDPVGPAASGLILDGDVRDLKVVRTAAGRKLLVAVNDAPLKVFNY